MIELSKPLKLSESYEIVDAGGSVVVPSITWCNDKAHLDKQKELGELIVKLLNEEEIKRKPGRPRIYG